MPATNPTAPPPEFLRELRRDQERQGGSPRLVPKVRTWCAGPEPAQAIIAPVAAKPALSPAEVTPGTLHVKAVKVTVVVRAEDALAITPAAGADQVPITVRTEAGRTFAARL